MIRRAAAVCLLLLAACRTTRPPNAEAIAPLTSTSPSEAAQQLADRRSQFRGERSLIRLRMPQISSRGQLQIDSGGRMLLTIYSPIGTTLGRLYSEGDEVIFLNDFEGTVWRGKSTDFGMFAGPVPMLLVGLPPAGLESITYGPAGIERVHLPDTDVRYDPAVYPPKKITIQHGQRQIEVEHLESFVDTATLKAPDVPSNYRCCVPPPL
ncbi:MAG TPA: hypothetical protein VGA33_10685 [Thermoanaerobaculia bacterium]